MSECLYCRREAGSLGYHPECTPAPSPAPAAPAYALAASRVGDPPASTPRPPVPLSTAVRVVDIDMPFLSMVNFMVKWAIAAIPAMIIIFVLVLGMLAFLRGIVLGR